jgi:hypothetical protein
MKKYIQKKFSKFKCNKFSLNSFDVRHSASIPGDGGSEVVLSLSHLKGKKTKNN